MVVVPQVQDSEGMTDVGTIRLGHDAAGEECCRVVCEETLTISIETVGSYTLMWTPTRSRGEPMAYTDTDGLLGDGELSEALSLAVGFMFTEGIVGALSDLRSVAFCPDNPGSVKVILANPGAANIRRRDVVINSSCGVCGEGEWFDSLCASLPAVGDGLVVTTDEMHRMMDRMQVRQVVFEATGGTHAAAVFDGAGQIIAFAEDLGRHNALDKVIGGCLFAGIDMAACGVLLSSRLSLEMVSKAIRAKFQVVAAISAPTSLAVELARRKRLTLCGFVRARSCTIYASQHRIVASAGLQN